MHGVKCLRRMMHHYQGKTRSCDLERDLRIEQRNVVVQPVKGRAGPAGGMIGLLICEAFALQYNQIFRSSRVEGQMRNRILWRDEVGIVQFRFKLLGVFGKDYTIASATNLSWTHNFESLRHYSMAGNCRGARLQVNQGKAQLACIAHSLRILQPKLVVVWKHL